ncbi:MAG: hypothetical protein J5594_02405 [Elusimicrobiaceae bacterium]|nr:hypothetical protein [Elusimicrobiaceae bacterium]
MSRKILKVLISILFLAAAAVAAVFSIKSFFPELFEQVKYGVKRIVGEPARKTPAFKKDNLENNNEVKPVGVQTSSPNTLKRPPYRRDVTGAYGVAPVRPIDVGRAKYGVAPVRPIPVYDDNTEKYGVAHIQKLEQENLLKNQIVYDVEELGQDLKK